MKTSLTVVLLVCSLFTQAALAASVERQRALWPAPPAPIIFYDSLLDGINRFAGSVTFNLNLKSQRWKTKVPGTTDVEWDLKPISPATKAVTATVYFTYRDGVLGPGPGAATIEFTPAIRASRTPFVGTAVIAKISFDGNGKPVAYRDDNDKEIDLTSWDVSPEKPDFSKHLKLFTKPRELFQNGPFGWEAKPKDPATTSDPLLLNMALGPPVETYPNAATLSDDSVLKFAPTSGVQFRVSNQSAFKLESLKYDFVSKALDGELSEMKLTLHSGNLAAKGLDMQLGEAVRVRFPKVAFTNSGAAPIVTLTEGSIVGNIRQGSYLQFSSKARETSVASDVGSSVGLFGVGLSVSASATNFVVGSGSGLDLRLLAARIPLVGQDYVNLREGNLSMAITSASWNSNTEPDFKGDVALLAATIQSGRFSITPGKSVPISGGLMRASRLAFDGGASQQLTGKFTEVTFEIEDGTTVEIPGRFLAITRTGTKLVANDAGMPFILKAGAITAAAGFRAVIPFWTCYAPPAGSPVIRDSMLRSTINMVGDGTIGGTDEIVDYTCCAN